MPPKIQLADFPPSLLPASSSFFPPRSDSRPEGKSPLEHPAPDPTPSVPTTSPDPTLPVLTPPSPECRSPPDTDRPSISSNLFPDHNTSSYHAPSVSQSSSASGRTNASAMSKASSQSSAPTSPVSSQRKRSVDASSITHQIDVAIAAMQPEDTQHATTRKGPMQVGIPCANMDLRDMSRSPSPGFLSTPHSPGLQLQGPPSPGLQLQGPSSPGLQLQGPPSPGLPQSPGLLPPRNPARTNTRPPSPLELDSPTSPDASDSRPMTAKGTCKGCALPIKGKSISSADGRLTGRYHKPCFVCTTCRAPFLTCEFYVIRDAPYCKRHYHELNHSLCSTCDSGIEGPYLDGEHGRKFHERCLRCRDCGTGLRAGYFEFNGSVFCERDAWRRTRDMQARQQQQQQQQHHHAQYRGPALSPNSPVGRHPMARMEKRSTKLMMMG